MRSIELLPDTAGEQVIRSAWERLRDAGLPTQAAHPHPTNRPHLTTAIERTPDPGPALHLLPRVLAELLPARAELADVIVFDGRGSVLVWLVEPAPALRAVREAVTTELGLPPEEWTPHLTLARRYDRSKLDLARELVADVRPAGPVTFTGARAYEIGARTVHTLV